ncbi:MAG TPA: ELM1/GtrOC1 family putative glycosyltransferase, partial [Candidatus Binatia bacterium]|nr:ELM1/GtrOC1 family putative glycosyltransferase [Candidatus Binatia bacterium]
MAIPPNVWVLLCSTAGDNGQLTSLADALGWPYETKRLVYNPLNRCPNLLLGASLLSLDRRRSSPLTVPWPDLVIAASRHSVPV